MRKYHGENWKSYMEGVIQGKIDPFKPTIKMKKQREIAQGEEKIEEPKKTTEQVK